MRFDAGLDLAEEIRDEKKYREFMTYFGVITHFCCGIKYREQGGKEKSRVIFSFHS